MLLASAPLPADDGLAGVLLMAELQVAGGATTPATTHATTSAMPPPVFEPPVPPPVPVPAADEITDDIVVTGRVRTPGDPLQQVNAKAFAVTQAVDDAIVGPAARAYERTVPTPIRDGFRNFFNNLHEPVIALNFLLQHKFGKAAETLGRFAVNSTVGGAGLFDVAKRRTFNLPRRRNSFSNTFGFYGIGPGPFLYLPFVGPTTLRDAIGGTLDGFVMPLAVGAPFNKPGYTIPTGINRGLDRRAELDEQIAEGRKEADPYATTREAYLKRRQAEIDKLRGRESVPPPPSR